MPDPRKRSAMEITVLVDNTLFSSRNLYAEHGFSAYIRDGKQSIVFDTGQSGVFLQNARTFGIDPFRARHVVLSHCHLDHTWGLAAYLRAIDTAGHGGRPTPHPIFLAHPALFRHVETRSEREIGMIVSEEILERYGTVRLSREPVEITDNLVFLGEIPRRFSFEGKTAIGTSGGEPDFVPDDTAVACRTGKGIVVVTGCAHAGICSVVERAKEVLGDDRVADVIGGFHLGGASATQIEETCRYFRDLGAAEIHPCHCTGLAGTIALAGAANVRATAVGLRLSFAVRS